MSCRILNGAPVAAEIDKRTAELTARLSARGVMPTLAIVRVGERDSDLAYERAVVRRCSALGICVRLAALTSEAGQTELMDSVRALNDDHSVHGIILLRPLPDGLDALAACAAISPEKDVDGVCPSSMARIYSGRGNGFSPCTAQSCMEIIANYGVELEGKRVAVLGRSLVVGKPAAMLLAAANATVTIFHSRSGDYTPAVRSADIVVSAVGKPELFGAEYFSKDQTVIDIGIRTASPATWTLTRRSRSSAR